MRADDERDIVSWIDGRALKTCPSPVHAASEFDAVADDRAVPGGHVDLDPHVWIGPLDLGNGAGESYLTARRIVSAITARRPADL
jgi:hypothetical protein